MSFERDSGNINFGMSVGVNPEVNVGGAEFDRNLEERQARERLANVMDAIDKPTAEAEPVREKMTGAAILQLVARRGENLEITRSRTAETGLERDAA